MPVVMNLRSVEDTTLWQRLKDGFRNTEHEQVATALSVNLVELCRDAADRMKAVPTLMLQYTLHDQVHLLRVTELMARVSGAVVESLNPVEIALHILSANFHDHGMVLDGAQIAALEADPAFRLHRDNWRLEHANWRQISQQLNDRSISEAQKSRLRSQEAELSRAMTTEFVRRTHGKRSREYVAQTYGSDRRWDIAGANVSGVVGALAESHAQPASWMTPANGFHHDRSIGTYSVNLPYLGVLLRLADILDFDRDRTPDVLYRAIHFTNTVSVQEWEKHRGVTGWVISPDCIRFTMEFDHPVYERTARRFMDWIDEELLSSRTVVGSFPRMVGDKYALALPQAVDRSRIGPKDQAYKYHDLEFSLSRDEIVKLLRVRLFSRNAAMNGLA